MNMEKMDNLPEDLISSLPEALITHILSFLSIEEAALTSVLSKKWRYLFAFVPNLDFRYPLYPEEFKQERDEFRRRFNYFVDRILTLQGNAAVKIFYLTCSDDIDPVYVTRWILNVSKRGLLDLELGIYSQREYLLRPKALVSKTLVRLAITGFRNSITIDVEDVFLPNLKTLRLRKTMLGNVENGVVKLVSGCPVLEELVLINNIFSDLSLSVSSKTLKTLYLHMENKHDQYSVSIDTPNLEYLNYSDGVAGNYPKVNFGSLSEANIRLRTKDQTAHASYGDLVGNATIFLMGICNVKTLCLTASTLEVFAFGCESIPIFINLIHLTIKTFSETGLESLLAFLKNCPNLETLVFDGLCHMDTNQLGDDDWCISSSPVKVLIIRSFGVISRYCGNVKGQVDQVKQFMETMPNLEQVILYFNSFCEEDWIYVSNELQMHPKVFLKLQDPNAHFIKV